MRQVNQSYGYILQWRKEGKLFTEVTSFSSWLTNRNLNVGDSSKDGVETIGCFGDGLTSFIAALTQQDIPIEISTLNSVWTFEYKVPEDCEGDRDAAVSLHQVVSSGNHVSPDLRHVVRGLPEAMYPAKYLFFEQPEEKFKGKQIELLWGQAHAGQIFVKGIFVQKTPHLGLFGVNYTGAAASFKEVGFGRDRSSLDLDRLRETAVTVLRRQEGEKRVRLAEHCLRELVDANKNHMPYWRPLFSLMDEGFAEEMLPLFQRVYPDGIPCSEKPNSGSLEAFIASMVGKKFVPVGRLFHYLATLEGVPKLDDYKEAYVRVLIELEGHPEASGEYAKALHTAAKQVGGAEADRILFKVFPEQVKDVILKVREEGGPVLYLVNLTALGKEAVHPDGRHYDGSSLAAGEPCKMGCGHRTFLSLLVKKLDLDVSKVIRNLTNGFVTPEGTEKEGMSAAAFKEKAAKELAKTKAEEAKKRAEVEKGKAEAEKQKAEEEKDRLAMLYLKGPAGVEATIKEKFEFSSNKLLRECLQNKGSSGSGVMPPSTVKEMGMDGTTCHKLPGLVRVDSADERVEILTDPEEREVGGPGTGAEFRKLGLDAFVTRILRLTGIFGVQTESVKVFWSTGALIAANKGGQLYFNLAYQNAMCDWGWFVTVAHELAHNAEEQHGFQHTAAVEALVARFAGQM